MRIRREIKGYIEAELKDYNDTLRQIGIEKNELILAGSVMDDSGVRGTDTSNPTQQKAFKLLTNKRIKRMEETCRAIERIINDLPEEKYRLVELRYWTRPRELTDNGIAMQLNIGIATYYRWSDDIIKAIAVEMGLMNAVS
jgi:RinA family phage transcriptional activator